ncbi:MAG: hypothetical protein B7Z73_01730 [Planctomycetia bacterium 21-64-5]|nr:MAG: hypothetical protein B7Z73_01730 [Planctomycetia bacterium 21-64-5]HQU42959.1 hypothetical protein [Pirellulales bacterium]
MSGSLAVAVWSGLPQPTDFRLKLRDAPPPRFSLFPFCFGSSLRPGRAPLDLGKLLLRDRRLLFRKCRQAAESK